MACFRWALAVLAAPVLTFSAFAASNPNFSGTWQLDAAKSPDAQGRIMTYTIQDASGKITFTQVVHAADGKDVTSQFTCDTMGTQCDFDDGGHKAHVSLWFSGSALMIMKSDGPKEDSATQWKLELAPGGKSLNVGLEHIDPAGKPETLVFSKKS